MPAPSRRPRPPVTNRPANTTSGASRLRSVNFFQAKNVTEDDNHFIDGDSNQNSNQSDTP